MSDAERQAHAAKEFDEAAAMRRAGPQPAEDLERALDRIEIAVSRGLTKQEVESNFHLSAIRAVLARERELREALERIEGLAEAGMSAATQWMHDASDLIRIREVARKALLAQPAAGKEEMKRPGKVSTRRIYNGIVHEMADRGAGTMCGLELPEPWTYTDDSVNCGACQDAFAADQPAEAGGEG